MEAHEAIGWLTLNRLPPGAGHAVLAATARLGGAAALVAASPAAWAAHGLDPALRHALAARAAQARGDLAWLDAPRRHLLTPPDPRYPPLLKTLADPPLALFVRGDPELLASPQLAIVGARRATAGGLRHAAEFAAALVAAGLAVTSGLARGIDAAAHRGCLDAGGRTVAVLATGPDRCYPAAHARLAEAIAAEGALVSEYPPGTGVRRWRFPWRNRLVSGLALGVLVVEATVRSGSLTTARHAAAQGREVFAVPGSIDNPMARGCHHLIREGAKLVERVEDILEDLGPLAAAAGVGTARQAAGSAGDGPHQELLEAMGFDPVTVDELVERCRLTAPELSSMLLLLEMQGLVEALPGGRYARSR